MIKQWIADMLNPVAQWLFSLLMMVPMFAVRLIFLGILAALGMWVIFMPPQRPEDGKIYLLNDLRFFAIGVLLIQSLFYIIF